MSEIEVFRLTPTQGKHYYAILASRTYWDNEAPKSWGGKGTNRYFAKETEKRYMGVFDSSMSYGSDYGKRHTEIYIKEGKRIQLDYDYEGKTCLIEADGPPKTTIMNPEEDITESKEIVAIDAQIADSKY